MTMSTTSRIPEGKPTLSKAWQQFNDNLGLFLYAWFFSLFLGAPFMQYPLTAAYVQGRYPSVKEFEGLVWKARTIKAALLFTVLWYLFIPIIILTTGIGLILPLLFGPLVPVFSHYVMTTDDKIMDCLKKSVLKTLKERELIFSHIAFTIAAFLVGTIACCGLGCIVTIPLAAIHFYNVVIHKKLLV